MTVRMMRFLIGISAIGADVVWLPEPRQGNGFGRSPWEGAIVRYTVPRELTLDGAKGEHFGGRCV